MGVYLDGMDEAVKGSNREADGARGNIRVSKGVGLLFW